MKTWTRIVSGGSAPLVALSLLLGACHDGKDALGPESPEGGDSPMVAAPAAQSALTFSAPQQWSSFFCRKGEVCMVADVTGDGKADAIAFSHGANASNAVFVAQSNGASLGPAQQWSSFFCTSTQTCATGDVNADFKADIIAFTRGTNPRVFVALSTGSGFQAPQQWSNFFCRNGEVCKVADVNGDVRADLVVFRHRLLGNRNAVYVGLSNGSSFGASQEWATGFCHSTETCEIGDLDGNGVRDILAMTRDPKNDVFARLSDRTKFVALGLWSAFFCRTGEVCLTGDVSGDRAAM